MQVILGMVDTQESKNKNDTRKEGDVKYKFILSFWFWLIAVFCTGAVAATAAVPIKTTSKVEEALIVGASAAVTYSCFAVPVLIIRRKNADKASGK